MLNESAFFQLCRNIGYEFQNPELLQAALTHRSSGGEHNERLEFLGDSLLNFVIAAELYDRFPRSKEGQLTRMRARLVRGETLAEIARDLQLGQFLQLGPGEQKTGGHQRDSILADALEAIIGALFLDGGIAPCRTRILIWYETRLSLMAPEASSEKDAKTRLQEFLQARRLPLPEYHIISVKGDPHDPVFQVHCHVSLLPEPILGVANNRRRAEQQAAFQALSLLQNEPR